MVSRPYIREATPANCCVQMDLGVQFVRYFTQIGLLGVLVGGIVLVGLMPPLSHTIVPRQGIPSAHSDHSGIGVHEWVPSGSMPSNDVGQGFDIVLMIDDSKSMEQTFDPPSEEGGLLGERFRFRLADFLVEYLLADSLVRDVKHHITIWAFGDGVTLLVGWRPVTTATFESIKAGIQPVGLGGTNFTEALKGVEDVLDDQPSGGNQPVVFIISDLMPGQGDRVERDVKAAQTTWYAYVGGMEQPVPVYLLSIDQKEVYPYNQVWTSNFFVSPLSDLGKVGSVRASGEDNKTREIERIFRELRTPPISTHYLDPLGVLLTTGPYLERVVFALISDHPNIQAPTPETTYGYKASLGVVGSYISVFEATRLRLCDTDWVIPPSDVEGRVLVGEVQPGLHVILEPTTLPIGQPVKITATLMRPEGIEPAVQLKGEWCRGDGRDDWQPLDSGEEIPNGRTWHLRLEREGDYLIRVWAEDADGREVASPTERRVAVVRLPAIAKVEPSQLTAGEPATLMVSVANADKMPNLMPTISMITGSATPTPYRAERVQGAEIDHDQVFASEAFTPSAAGQVEVTIFGQTEDDVVIRDKWVVATATVRTVVIEPPSVWDHAKRFLGRTCWRPVVWPVSLVGVTFIYVLVWAWAKRGIQSTRTPLVKKAGELALRETNITGVLLVILSVLIPIILLNWQRVVREVEAWVAISAVVLSLLGTWLYMFVPDPGLTYPVVDQMLRSARGWIRGGKWVRSLWLTVVLYVSTIGVLWWLVPALVCR
jgi:hypothetical protein